MIKKGFVVVFIIGFLFYLLQIPFLNSDPDINISWSRGANTDEGLNTCQIRNFVNHNDLTLNKSDNFIKTPLFGSLLYLPFKIFGSNLLTGRIFILCLSLFLCLIIFSKNNYYLIFGIITTIIVFGQYYIFHFFHFCLAEILSTVFIFFSLFILVESEKTQSTIKSSFLSATLISLAYFLKIQFLYGVFILPLAITFFILTDSMNRKRWGKQLLYTIIFLSIYIVIYYICWYSPNKQLFDYIMNYETTNRFVKLHNGIGNIIFIVKYTFYNQYLKYFTSSFFILFVFGIIYSVKIASPKFKLLFIAISCWIFIESHKFSMLYLPTRYLISLYFSMGLIIALVITEMLYYKENYKKIVRVISIVIFFVLMTINVNNYLSSFKNRTYSIMRINEYLSKYNFENQPIMGAWAPSLCWKTKALSFPIFHDYFNDKNVLTKYNPAIIIAELDDLDDPFLSKGIILENYADSVRYFKINNWKIKILWIKPNNRFNTLKKSNN